MEQGEGKEILYFWIGRSALFLGDPDEAEEALEKALQIDPSYARAQIVLPGAEFRRIQSILHDSEKSLQVEDVQQLNERMEGVISGYQRGVELAQASHEPLTEFIARLALAGAYRIQAEIYSLLQDDVQAKRFFDLTINEITPVLEPLAEAKQHRILAQAYQYLGAAHTQQAAILQKQGDLQGSQASYERARQAFAGCIEQEVGAPEDEILRSAIIADSCVPLDRYAQEALLGLERE
jgi:tetratricopeptide (TPR) repeat protein